MLIRHLVSSTESLRTLSVRYLGSAALWPQIAAANGLENADITSFVGTEILIPVSSQDTGPVEDPYLIDLAIENGDLVLDPFTGDLKTVGGVDNFVRSILRALSTNQGDLSEHPDYGFGIDTYAGEAITSLYPRFLKLEVERVIRTDPRTKDVPEVTVDFDGTKKWLSIGARILDFLGVETRLSSGMGVNS